jgi:uncharacterized repeat protein (TIGR03943 family)
MHSQHDQDHHHRHDHFDAHAQGQVVHPSRLPWMLRSAVLLATGLYFLLLFATGSLGNYVNANYAWLTLGAAGLFGLLGLNSLYLGLRPRADVHTALDHVHPRVSLWVLVVVALPVALGALVPSAPLGASAVREELAPADVSASGLLLSSPNSNEWTVVDWLRAFYYSGQPEQLNGKEADVVGFVFHRPDDPPGSFMLTRFVMSCCAADSYAVGVPVKSDQAAALPTDTWVRVQGQARVGQFGKNVLPIIEAAAIDSTVGKPAQPYLYQ